jgi:ERCC4-related helicase
VFHQVDLIVNFDTTSSPIRSTQRAGRTGRHRSGRVVYLLTRGREEDRYRAQLEEGAKVKVGGSRRAKLWGGVGRERLASAASEWCMFGL